MKGSFQLLVGPLSLPISLWMKARGKTKLSSNGGAKLFPNTRGELRSSDGDNVLRDAVKTENVVGE